MNRHVYYRERTRLDNSVLSRRQGGLNSDGVPVAHRVHSRYIVELPTSSAIAINFAWFITSSFAFRTQFGLRFCSPHADVGFADRYFLSKSPEGESLIRCHSQFGENRRVWRDCPDRVRPVA
jgi:hypothetical protein